MSTAAELRVSATERTEQFLTLLAQRAPTISQLNYRFDVDETPSIDLGDGIVCRGNGYLQTDSEGNRALPLSKGCWVVGFGELDEEVLFLPVPAEH